jgi:hypothetical protein
MRFMCCWHTFRIGDELRLDEEGFLICPEHAQRRYGWKSPRRRSVPAHPFDPMRPRYVDAVDYAENDLGRDQAVTAEFMARFKLAGVPMTQAEHDKYEAELLEDQ